MKDEWVKFCLHCLEQPADFYSNGNRKIIRGMSYKFKSFEPTLLDKDIGYTKQKLTLLKGLYYHEEAVKSASELWAYFIERGGYASACFHTYNHLIKVNAWSPGEKRPTRSPCLQSVVLTLLKNKTTSIDVFYRTTEIFKKFPADLIFLKWVLDTHFSFKSAPLVEINFHFANLTCHPMYISTLMPHVKDPLRLLKTLRESDPAVFKQSVRWLGRYLEKDGTVGNFKQARSVQRNLFKNVSEEDIVKLRKYIEKVSI